MSVIGTINPFSGSIYNLLYPGGVNINPSSLAPEGNTAPVTPQPSSPPINEGLELNDDLFANLINGLSQNLNQNIAQTEANSSAFGSALKSLQDQIGISQSAQNSQSSKLSDLANKIRERSQDFGGQSLENRFSNSQRQVTDFSDRGDLKSRIQRLLGDRISTPNNGPSQRRQELTQKDAMRRSIQKMLEQRRGV